MSKWCETCHRNEITGEWRSCSDDCPVFGKFFDDLAKIVIEYEAKADEWIADMESSKYKVNDSAYAKGCNDVLDYHIKKLKKMIEEAKEQIK